MPANTFDDILGLEEKFYDDGYQQGMSDGVKAGRIEGRTFGLEKGFEKYIESGRLYGKSIVWANRSPQALESSVLQKESDAKSPDGSSNPDQKLPQLSDHLRLAKHIKVLHALAESESLSTENSEEAVSDFDDRLKRAQAKVKIIERMTGETEKDAEGTKRVQSINSNIEDASLRGARH